MHVAVTGSTGHIGANLIPLLLETGHQVRALYRTPSHHAALAGYAVETLGGDILDPAFLAGAFRGVDAVVHLAGAISIDGDPGGRVMRTNVEGARHVVDACLAAGVGRLIHFSSIDAVRYRRTDPVVDETTPLVGDDAFAYRLSKRRGEEEVWQGAARGLPVVILCPTAVIGPGDHFLSASGHMLRGLFANRLPALVAAGFDWVDVRDVARATLAALTSPLANERYLLPGRWASIPELARLCRRVSGRPAPRLVLPLWTASLGLPFLRLHSRLSGRTPLYTRESLSILRNSSRRFSPEKARRDLGYETRPLEETLRDTWNWYVEKSEISDRK